MDLRITEITPDKLFSGLSVLVFLTVFLPRFLSDINECTENHECEDICENTDGDYDCDCDEGMSTVKAIALSILCQFHSNCNVKS